MYLSGRPFSQAAHRSGRFAGVIERQNRGRVIPGLWFAGFPAMLQKVNTTFELTWIKAIIIAMW
jgi:hypothetical protein